MWDLLRMRIWYVKLIAISYSLIMMNPIENDMEIMLVEMDLKACVG